MFRSICPPTFFRCLSNSGTYTELRTTTFIEFTGVDCSDSVNHNRVQVLSIPVLLLACSEDWTCNLQVIRSLRNQPLRNVSCWTVMANRIRTGDPCGFHKGHSSKKAGEHIVRNVVEITIKMKTIVRKLLMIKIIKLRLRNSGD